MQPAARAARGDPGEVMALPDAGGRGRSARSVHAARVFRDLWQQARGVGDVLPAAWDHRKARAKARQRGQLPVLRANGRVERHRQIRRADAFPAGERARGMLAQGRRCAADRGDADRDQLHKGPDLWGHLLRHELLGAESLLSRAWDGADVGAYAGVALRRVDAAVLEGEDDGVRTVSAEHDGLGVLSGRLYRDRRGCAE